VRENARGQGRQFTRRLPPPGREGVALMLSLLINKKQTATGFLHHVKKIGYSPVSTTKIDQ
jgi:hypothetical protein